MKRLARTIELIIKPVTGKPDNRREPATRENSDPFPSLLSPVSHSLPRTGFPVRSFVRSFGLSRFHHRYSTIYNDITGERWLEPDVRKTWF